MKKITAKNYIDLENIGDISNEAMQMHFKLYEGYVNNVNIIIDKLDKFEKNSPEWNELNRRTGWERNGVKNHELFFESLQNQSHDLQKTLLEKSSSIFLQKIEKDFGGFENWKKEFVSMCKIRGMGWVMLLKDNQTGELFNHFVNEHDGGMLSDVSIIFLVDMFEHAYIRDFGTDRQGYIDSIFSHINIDNIEKRLEK